MPLAIRRERLLAEVRSALDAGPVGLWGPPGAGRHTVAAALGLVAVECAGAPDPAAVAVRALEVLGLPRHGDPLARLRAATEDGPGLALHDPDTAAAVPALSGRVLVTSRDRGTLEGLARRIELAPLSDAEAADALQGALPDAPPDAIATLVAHAGGLPGALEALARRAAAAGIGVVSAALAARTGTDPLDDALALGWEALGPDREALAALAVPRVPFDLAAAEALGVPAPVVERLVAGSWLREDAGRLALLAPIARFVRRRSPRSRRAWAAAVLARAEPDRLRWEELGDGAAEDRLRALAPALRDVWDELAGGDLVRALLALEPEIVRDGPYAPALARLRSALDADPEPDLRARGHRLLGELCAWSQELDAADEALAAATGAGGTVAARAGISRAWVALHRDPEAARALLDDVAAGVAAVGERRLRDRLQAHWHGIAGALALRGGDPAASAGHHRLAARFARSAGDRGHLALSLRNLGDLLAETGDADAATAALDEARDLARRSADRRAEALVCGTLGAVALDRGEPAAATAHLAASVALARALGDRRLEGLVIAYLGAARLVAGDLPAARAALDRAVACGVVAENATGTAFATALRAAVHTAAGAPEPAARDAAAARERSHGRGNPVLEACVAALVDGVAPDPALVASSYDVRLAVAIGRSRPVRPPEPVAAADALLLAGDGAWFEHRGVRVDLAARGPVRRVLGALAARHVQSPGAPADVEDLFRAGWPGERAVRTAARNRVYNAIYQLRKLGLEGWLVRRDDGFCLRADAPIVAR